MNNTIRLAVDLDGVLTEHPGPLARHANQTFGTDLPDNTFVDSAGLNVPDSVRCWVYGPQGPAVALRPSLGARDFLTEIVDTFGCENVRIITARPEDARETTRQWLREHGFTDCDIMFADDKVTIANALGITHAVEDSLRHAVAYAGAGITCFLLWNGDEPTVASPLIIPVADLSEALRRLREIAPAADTETEKKTRTMSTAKGEGSQTRPRIVISDVIDERARAVLAQEAELIDVDGTDIPAFMAAVKHADALIVRSESQVTRAVLSAAPMLRVVARAGVGVDNIDVQCATEAGILVLNTPGANAVSAGEHTIALLLAIARAIPDANATTHAGRWDRKRFKPFDLRCKTVGLIGIGRVGSIVAQRLKAFEMPLIGYDPYITRERFAQLGIEPVSYETLLETADIVSFHTPATPETTKMLDAKAIARLKPGAIVLNCARGEVVDEEALADALRSGHITGAGVDVFPSEPARESPLFDLPNAILTPHIGGSSKEALATVGQVISTTTLAALRGEAVPNAVNLPPASLNAPDLQRLTHVAGAAGHLLAVLQPEIPADLSVTVQGVVPADVIEHVAGAALSEALRRWTDRRVTPVNARLVAQELDLEVKIATGDADPAVTPEFAFEVDGHSPHRVTVRWNRKDAGILEVDRFSLERPLVGDVLITHHQDRPGIVGRLGTILGEYRVNIAGMQVGRHQRGGAAIMVLNVDDAIPEEALADIRTIPGIETVYVVSLPPALPPAVPAGRSSSRLMW